MTEWGSGVLDCLVGAAVGSLLQMPYIWVARRRWGATWIDPVRAILYRCQVDSSWSQKDRLLHGLLWLLKQAGFWLIAISLGFLGYGLLVDRSALS